VAWIFPASHQAGNLAGLFETIHITAEPVLIAMFPRAKVAVAADS
jgi:hypothetical protein